MAEQLIDSLSAQFDPSKFHDEYRERVLDLIERKAAGEEITVQPQAEEPAAAPDLMAALEASLAAVHERRAEAKPRQRQREAAQRRQPARSARAKQATRRQPRQTAKRSRVTVR